MTLLEGKTAAWHANRRTGIGGSDARIIMDGSDEERLRLWEKKVGLREEDDLSDILWVMMGEWTEPYNVAWLEKHAGITVDRSARDFRHPQYDFARCETDGMVGFSAIVETKHLNGFKKEEEYLEKYYPQIQHNMGCAGVSLCYFSVFLNILKWVYFKVEADPNYQAGLFAREGVFWSHVLSKIAPVPPATATPKIAVAFTDMREVSMQGNNLWGDKAATWIELAPKVKKLEKVAKEIKEMVEDDVSKASGHGITVSRSKAGALTIRGAK